MPARRAVAEEILLRLVRGPLSECVLRRFGKRRSEQPRGSYQTRHAQMRHVLILRH